MALARGDQTADQAAQDPEAPALEALGRGDHRAALTLLMRAYGTQLYRFCLEMTRDPAAADDLLQAVFIQAHQALPRYVHRASLRSWLYGIARHRCLDEGAGKRRWARLVEQVPELPEVAGPGPTAESGLSGAQHRAALEECLQALPARVRETLLLRFRGELSYDEMAGACGERVGTLRVRVARALPLLRRCLQGKGVEP
jgi:RNA polymerase sigma-70 factor (ECF subfamily)